MGMSCENGEFPGSAKGEKEGGSRLGLSGQNYEMQGRGESTFHPSDTCHHALFRVPRDNGRRNE